MRLDDALERFFSTTAALEAGQRVIVAFSGGPDSTALLWGVARLARRRGFEVLAVHLDHDLDSGSAARAEAAAASAHSLGVPIEVARRDVRRSRRPGESVETAARRVRYAFLEEVRQRTGARWVATAHHRDDQAETVALRIRFGTGPAGLAGILPRWGTVVRPLLELPRSDLAAALEASGLTAVSDPTNQDLASPRNRLRHRVLPALEAREPELAARLSRIAAAARGARRRLRWQLAARLDPRRISGGLTLERSALTALPTELRGAALAEIHRRAGLPFPARRRAHEELLRQLDAGAAADHRVGCDCGGGWRWEGRGTRLALVRRQPTPPPAAVFTYTLGVPGELVVQELRLRVRLTFGPVAPWMFQGSASRAGLTLPLEPGDRVEIRNRRPGDRLQPLGASGSRRLKDVLIDRGVPRRQRDRLPLLVVAGRIAWVPGVTIDDRFRLRGGNCAWIAEIERVRG